MNYQGILQFRGTWRTYQARVLGKADQYIKDGRIHIVAAPGSGKTTLGIELIRRLNQTALVLAPSITIREQWISRIEEAFLCDGVKAEDYLSQNLKAPKAITVVTYQALHSAMTKYKGVLADEDEDKDEKEEDVDFSDFDLIKTMQENQIGVICLDECHHLRSEWWKALEEFKKKYGELKVIALTATPPFDSTPAMWTRYMNMCGEIDEEITIPELVKEGSLCPHQDYVYFNYPTADEQQAVTEFAGRSRQMMERLMADEEFAMYVKSHVCMTDASQNDVLLENPSYLSALLIFYKAKGIAYPKRLQRLLGAKQLPDMEEKWMELLLQGFLYDDADSYVCDKSYREQVISQLKEQGLVEKKKVNMVTNDTISKLMTTSKGKCNSIRDIVKHEYQNMGNGLRLLVLTDYIRKEYEKAIGVPEKDVMALGVLPFFEMLRREAGNQLKLGVLCGSVVIIPAQAREALEQEITGVGKVTYSSLGALSETEYVKVNPVGDMHFLTGAITGLFAKGYMQVLIGTKSLLGEGWDSPCINSLILASFVGSFMLSNQMRGRAIRVWKENPEKTSNIWHLVCLRPWKEMNKDTSGEISEDYSLLNRRMENFLGLHYTEDSIENNMDRLSIIRSPFSKANVEKMNQEMLETSDKRDTLKARWNKALTSYEKMEVVDEVEVKDKYVTVMVFFDVLKNFILTTMMFLIMGSAYLFAVISGQAHIAAFGYLAAIGFAAAMTQLPRLMKLGTPLGRLQVFGQGIYKALKKMNLLESDDAKVKTDSSFGLAHATYLFGGSGRDKALYAQCVNEFFSEIDNQRYILVKKGNHRKLDGVFAVPECFAKKKEDAEAFAECMKGALGHHYDAVYTRNEKGRELLLEGRVRALGNKEERCASHKKVKSALE